MQIFCSSWIPCLEFNCPFGKSTLNLRSPKSIFYCPDNWIGGLLQPDCCHVYIDMCLIAYFVGCLERLIGNVLRGYIRCPACKRDTMIPGLTNEVTKLAKNFGVLDLLESIEEEKNAATAAATIVNPVSNVIHFRFDTILERLRTPVARHFIRDMAYFIAI